MAKHNLTVGQILYKEDFTYRGAQAFTITSQTITKIGKKYFYCNNNDVTGFNIEGLEYVNGTTSSSYVKLYLTDREIKDKWELEAVASKVRNIFYTYNFPKLTTDQFRRIIAIVEEGREAATS